MKGSTFKRCRCRTDDGRDLGTRCPKLKRTDGTWNPRHGVWYFKLELEPGANGQRRYLKRGGFATREEALDAMSDAKVKAGRGRDLTTRLTFGTWFDRWLTTKRQSLQRSTTEKYAQHGRAFLKPHLGHIELDRLRVDHVSVMFRAIEEDNARIEAARASDDPAVRASVKGQRVTGPVTQQRIRATLRSCLADAVRQQLIDVNVAQLVDLKPGRKAKALVWTRERVEAWRAEYELALAQAEARGQEWRIWRSVKRPSPVMVWTPQQTGAFLDHVVRHRLYALFHLVAYRGLRRGEVCGLRWEDVDLEAGTITPRRQLRQIGWEVEEADLKTDGSEATIALDRATVEVVRAHRVRQSEERLAWGEAWQGRGHVFTREDGSLLHPAVVTATFERLAFEAGLPPVRLHDLRHGAATLALAAGVDMKVVQEMLRHSSITITADIYSSVLPEMAHEAAEAAAAMIPRVASGGSVVPLGSPTVPHDGFSPLRTVQSEGFSQVDAGRPGGARTRDPGIMSSGDGLSDDGGQS